MAGESLSLTELKQWYSTFNTVIKNYSGGTISELATPDGGAVIPSDINALYDKITAMKNDEFLGTQPTYYSTFTKVAQGELVERADATPIINTATKIAAIKCRNTTTYTNQYNTHGAKNNETYTNGADTQGKYGNGTHTDGKDGNLNNAHGYCYQWGNGHWCNNGMCYWGDLSNGSKSHGSKSNGNYSYGNKSNGDNTHGDKSNQSYKDILNVNTIYNKNT